MIRFTEREAKALIALAIAGVGINENTLCMFQGITKERATELADITPNLEESQYLLKMVKELKT